MLRVSVLFCHIAAQRVTVKSVCLVSGVGQSEFAVADMVDMFVLLIPPAGGDELQVSEKRQQLQAKSVSGVI